MARPSLPNKPGSCQSPPPMRPPNFYAAAGLDRAGHRRKDAAWVAERLADPATRFVPLWRSQNLVLEAEARWVLLAAEEIEPFVAEPVLLGLAEQRALFAVDLSAHERPLEALSLAAPAEFVDLRRVGPLLARHEGSILAYARGILWWHQRHRFCGLCGAPTASGEAGHVRACTNADCRATHFPRTDPAVIMLVHDGERCLLGRQAIWPKGMHSTLAGFVEPGESLEEAVAREVMEETAIEVTDVAYHSSQPWPFPSSIMLGFHARAVTTEIRVDPVELEDARWFERAQLLAHREDSDEFRLPRRDSIARRLIEDWLRR
jgi:NAD+ diphosphatase